MQKVHANTLDAPLSFSSYFSNQDTYWLSTGVFPQEIIVSFQSMVAMETILLRCSKGNRNKHTIYAKPCIKTTSSVARLRVERSEEVSMGNFQAVTEKGKF